MAQIFKIKQNSELPTLRMELIDDGKYDFLKNETYNNAIQNADITFSMKDERGVLKVSKAKVDIINVNCECSQKYLLEYKWKKRDTKEKGIFTAWFEIDFHGDIYQEGIDFPEGKLIMPIQEELKIHIL